MITVSVNEQSELPTCFDYPLLARANGKLGDTSKGVIVLFSCDRVGTVVSGGATWKVGYHGKTWSPMVDGGWDILPSTSVVTLHN